MTHRAALLLTTLHAFAIIGPRTAAQQGLVVGVTSATTLRIGIAREDGGYTVRAVPLEEYVAGVLAGEAARDSGPAALEALAITIRTFALANRGRHAAESFDLCDLTHCQVFRTSTHVTARAAADPAGQILLYNGAPASVFYNASCGGHTERPSEVWPGALNPSYLPSRADDACEGEPAWDADLAAADLARALRAGGFRGNALGDLRIAGRSESGRVTRLRVDGFTPNEISGQDLRTIVGRTLGWQHIKSTAFDLRRGGSAFHFSGHGFGHGVGLCVVGSVNLAARGESAERILARYFPGLKISARAAASTSQDIRRDPNSASGEIRLKPAPSNVEGPDPTGNNNNNSSSNNGSGVTVALPEGDEGERDFLQSLASRSRDALAKRLGVARPPGITLRFHPTVESYQRASGRPWFTTAATVGTDMHFVPLTVLRQRGVLERTVRHELVHVLTEPALAGRPLWVREGAALYFAGESSSQGDAPRRSSARARLPCPADRDLQQPVSPGALSTAYTQAAACFARQIESGKKWSEIR